ncbi:MAG: glycerol-3-phosphate dehydrogenase, partial [Chloroflexota bacterium]
MGTGLTTPAAQNGHDVRLWGTELDHAIVSALRAGHNHPRLRVPVAPTV